eukprot:snap_masked-scaffold_10-processed-gene-7.8-mRNA-1 protein AED:1.00 eAED:1.00 QI:0/0/0/0/1/1/4/0/77
MFSLCWLFLAVDREQGLHCPNSFSNLSTGEFGVSASVVLYGKERLSIGQIPSQLFCLDIYIPCFEGVGFLRVFQLMG